MGQVLAAPAPRVAHVVGSCFARTETFIYEQVIAPLRFESWCLAGRILNAAEFPFDRVRLCDVQWGGRRMWDLIDRALWRVRPGHQFPLWRSIRAVRPALVHAHFAPVGCNVMHLASRYGLPLVTSFYGYDASSLPRVEGWLPRLQELFARGDAFVAEGPAMKDRLVGLGCAPDKVKVVPLLVNTGRYRWHPRVLDPNQPRRVLFVGRFAPKKGLSILFKAVASVRPALSPLELVIIGGGSETAEADARRLVRELALEDVTRFTGGLPRKAVLEEMARAHVLVAPSQTAPDGDTEGGAPTVLLEAQASGLPIVATRHADIPFVAAPVYHDFLAEEGNAEDLATKLLTMLQASGRWPALGRDGREHVQQQHGPSAYSRLGDLYDGLLASSQGGR